MILSVFCIFLSIYKGVIIKPPICIVAIQSKRNLIEFLGLLLSRRRQRGIVIEFIIFHILIPDRRCSGQETFQQIILCHIRKIVHSSHIVGSVRFGNQIYRVRIRYFNCRILVGADIHTLICIRKQYSLLFSTFNNNTCDARVPSIRQFAAHIRGIMRYLGNIVRLMVHKLFIAQLCHLSKFVKAFVHAGYIIQQQGHVDFLTVRRFCDLCYGYIILF